MRRMRLRGGEGRARLAESGTCLGNNAAAVQGTAAAGWGLHGSGGGQEVQIPVVLEIANVGIPLGAGVLRSQREPTTEFISDLEPDGFGVIRAIDTLVLVLLVPEVHFGGYEVRPGVRPDSARRGGKDVASQAGRFRRESRRIQVEAGIGPWHPGHERLPGRFRRLGERRIELLLEAAD